MEFVKIYNKKSLLNNENGNWQWDDMKNTLNFIPQSLKLETFGEDQQPKISLTSSRKINLKFKSALNEDDELIFRRIFAKPSESYSSKYITIQDIKNLVFYLAPSEVLNKDLIEFFHTETIDKFLNALIIYFEYFIKVKEFLYMRREEVNVYGKIRTLDSVKIEESISDYLTQYRILVAREYAQIILGKDKKIKSLHLLPCIILTSLSGKYKPIQENFIPFVTHIVWIAMHRKSFNVIVTEINRLFNPKSSKKLSKTLYTEIERQILYGRNYKYINCVIQQHSPLIEELLYISENNYPLLTIGFYKYCGTDSRILRIELELMIPDNQLHLYEISHGILGHPKSHYDTMVRVVCNVIKKYNNDYDPYKFIQKPLNFDIPKWEDYKIKYKIHIPYFNELNFEFEKDIVKKQKNLWLRRDKIIREEKVNGIDDDLTFKIKKNKN